MSSAVAYYTRFGHTRVFAEQLARELGAELREIRGTREHSYPAMVLGALLNRHFPIEPMNLDFSSFEFVVLCTPIWLGRPACPTRTFLREARLKGTRLAVALSTWGGDEGMAIEHIKRELAGKGVKVDFSTHVVTKDASDEALRLAGQELAKRISFELSELQRLTAPAEVLTNLEPRTPGS